MWSDCDGVLRRSVTFGSFAEAIAFVNRLAELAERAHHHPDIDVRYKTVTISWTTHSAGGITARDRELASLTDGLLTDGLQTEGPLADGPLTSTDP